MLELLFPRWSAKREKAKYVAATYRQATQIIESTPEFAHDEDEGQWNLIGGDKEPYTEQDLDTMRKQARKLYYRGVGARGIISAMQSFIIGRNAGVMASDIEAQAYWDAWVEQVKFDRRSKELIKRLLRDGEFFIRFFPAKDELNYEVTIKPDGGGEPKTENRTAKYMTFRFIDPEEIKDETNRHSYGIETDPDDVETPVRYYRTFYKGDIKYTDIIDADEIIHGKILCDSNEKRGKSFLIGISRYLKEYEKWLDDRIKTNRLRNLFHFIAKPDGAMGVSALKNKFQDEDSTPSGSTPRKKMPKPGSMLLAKGVDFEFKSLNMHASDTAADGRNIERMICKETQLVEGVVTGDYSNNNFSSALIAESPMVRSIEDWQDIIGGYIIEMFSKVIIYAVESGASFIKNDKCTVDFATMIHRNLQEDTNAYQVHRQNRWASDKTISTKLGYDYEGEQEQIDKEDERERERVKVEEPEFT